MADHMLDARGLRCPMPVLKARKAMVAVAAGQTLEVVTNDPGSVADFKEFCAASGHAMLEQTEAAGEYRFLIRRAT